MRHRSWYAARGLAWVVAFTLAPAAMAAELGMINRLFRGDMPSQSQHHASFVAGGRAYCGPVAASNGLMWLAERGFPGLRPSASSPEAAHQEMIQRLASLMGTYRDGTPLSSFQCGINTYLRLAGYPKAVWSSSGQLSKCPPVMQAVAMLRDDRTVIWLGLGRYEFDASRKTYQRKSGHMVSLAGYESGPQNESGIERLFVVDPEHPKSYRTLILEPLWPGRISDGRRSFATSDYRMLIDLDPENADPRITLVETIQALTLDLP